MKKRELRAYCPSALRIADYCLSQNLNEKKRIESPARRGAGGPSAWRPHKISMKKRELRDGVMVAVVAYLNAGLSQNLNEKKRIERPPSGGGRMPPPGASQNLNEKKRIERASCSSSAFSTSISLSHKISMKKRELRGLKQ